MNDRARTDGWLSAAARVALAGALATIWVGCGGGNNGDKDAGPGVIVEFPDSGNDTVPDAGPGCSRGRVGS